MGCQAVQIEVRPAVKTRIHYCDVVARKRNKFLANKRWASTTFFGAVVLLVVSGAWARADALTGFYTQVAVGDPDFGGGTNAGGTLGTGLIANQLGPNGLPVLSAPGIARLGTSSDMNPTTHELLWWSAGANPYVSLDSNPVQTNTLPLNYGYPNVNWYPTGQTGDNNFFRTVQWQGTFTMGTTGSISLYLQADDDAWAFIDGTLVAEDHYGYVSNTSTAVSAGTHSIKLFYDDRFPVYDQIVFTSSVPILPVPEPTAPALLMGGAMLLLARRLRRMGTEGT